MANAIACPECGAPARADMPPCPKCGSPLAGTRGVVEEPLRQEAIVAHGLLASSGLHPILAYHDVFDVPHPLDPEEPFSRAAGLIVPATTSFGVYLPENEVGRALRILAEARRALAPADVPGGAPPAKPPATES